jgi:hypothetical protein
MNEAERIQINALLNTTPRNIPGGIVAIPVVDEWSALARSRARRIVVDSLMQAAVNLKLV